MGTITLHKKRLNCLFYKSYSRENLCIYTRIPEVSRRYFEWQEKKLTVAEKE